MIERSGLLRTWWHTLNKRLQLHTTRSVRCNTVVLNNKWPACNRPLKCWHCFNFRDSLWYLSYAQCTRRNAHTISSILHDWYISFVKTPLFLYTVIPWSEEFTCRLFRTKLDDTVMMEKVSGNKWNELVGFTLLGSRFSIGWVYATCWYGHFLQRRQQPGQGSYEWRNASHFDSTPCGSKLFGWSFPVFFRFLNKSVLQ